MDTFKREAPHLAHRPGVALFQAALERAGREQDALPSRPRRGARGPLWRPVPACCCSASLTLPGPRVCGPWVLVLTAGLLLCARDPVFAPWSAGARPREPGTEMLGVWSQSWVQRYPRRAVPEATAALSRRSSRGASLPTPPLPAEQPVVKEERKGRLQPWPPARSPTRRGRGAEMHTWGYLPPLCLS